MALKPQIARFVAAAAFLAALWLAPSVVQAHAGHGHVSHAVHHDASPATKQTVQDAVPAELTAATADAPMKSADDAGCGDRGCCTTGPCTMCGAVMAPDLVAALPLAGRSKLALGDAPPCIGLPSEGPKRPPKHFA